MDADRADKIANLLLGIGKIIGAIATVITGAAYGCHYSANAVRKKNAKKEGKKKK